jgi:hypothetical protein
MILKHVPFAICWSFAPCYSHGKWLVVGGSPLLIALITDWPAGWLAGWLASWLAGCRAGWLAGCLAGWLAGLLTVWPLLIT